MENTNILHGSTSIGLPGENGNKGARSRLFFYGNSKLASPEGNIHFVIDGVTKYAKYYKEMYPEQYDYIFYTETPYDYIYIIKNCQRNGNYFICDVEEIDKIDLSEIDYSAAGSTTFIMNIVSRAWSRTVRDPNEWKTISVIGDFYCYPGSYIQTTYNLLYDFSITVPSTSNYTFTPNIKITIEFNSLQSFQMDSKVVEKFNDENVTYRGNIEAYAIMDYFGRTRIENFDDERLENFTITIKDYTDGIGSKYFTNSIPLMAEPLRRFKSNPRAFVCVYEKQDYFIKKTIVGELNLDFILNASPTSSVPSVTRIQIEETI